MFKKYGFSILTAIFLFSSCAALAFATGPGDFDLKIEGDLIAGKQVYGSEVTITLTPQNPKDRLLIQDQGTWMELTPDEKGIYNIHFTKEREYRLRFCAQSPDGIRGPSRSTYFVINQALVSAIEAARTLPDLYTATDEDIQKAKERILDAQSKFTDLPEHLRALFPEAQVHRLKMLVGWLQNILPREDVLPPKMPTAVLSGRKAPGADIYGGEVTLEIKHEQLYDVDMICIRAKDIWQYIEPVDGVYRVSFSKPGIYSLDICARDAAGNHSPARSVSFTIDPISYDFLKRSAQAFGKDTEQVLLDYHAMNRFQRTRIGQLEASRLQTACRWQYDAHQIGWESTVNGRPVQAIGMLTAFPGGNVRFEMTGAPSSQQIPGVDKKTLYAYTISFSSVQPPAAPILFRVALPAELMEKRGVQVYGADNQSVTTRIKNDDTGLILEFFVAGSGNYYVTANAA